MSNSAKGLQSQDLNIGTDVVSFFNRNNSPYPTEIGSPCFEPVPVEQKKDVMINVARMHAEQEYNRIIELVNVLQNQADAIKRRLEITDLVHSAKYSFEPCHGKVYWLAKDHLHNENVLCLLGPTDWSNSAPDYYEYICAVKWLGDHTWVEVEGDPSQ